ncbi:helix-turn-helix domain-containing protein [Brevibacterium sp.]|uniref:helix-turn-helix domain-containing protein n=1 Tax=Brevibacterium sp. TaxID=1701 RepID=UPI002811EF02|nr:helix-turn-helix domain-containing protein [Brevibacterium sp.]
MTKDTRRSPGAGEVRLADFVSAYAAELTQVHHLAPVGGVIRDLALISDIEEIIGVGPDTLVVLSDTASQGDWMVSAGLRYAWERRAAGLVVPHSSVTKTAVRLAERLGVSLLSTEYDATRTALDLALRIGLTRSGQVARLQQFTSAAARANGLRELLGLVSTEVGGRRVRVETAGSIVFSVTADEVELDISNDQMSEGVIDGEAIDGLVEVSAEVTGGKMDSDVLRIFVSPDEREYAGRVLEAVAPSVRALTAEFRLSSLTSSLPSLTIAALTGSSRFDLIGEVSWNASEAAGRWPLTGSFVSVCVLAEERDSSAVHQVWHATFPDVPLARIDSGWLALVPVRAKEGKAAVLAAVRAGFTVFADLDLGVGMSDPGMGPERVAAAVQEAWLAARLARSSDRTRSKGSGPVLEFAAIPLGLAQGALPRELAVELARAMFPELLADVEAHVIIETIVALLDCRGSVSKAAQRLGVHRNTLHARLRRAGELGVPLGDPDSTLSLHLILTGLLSARGFRSGTTPSAEGEESRTDRDSA